MMKDKDYTIGEDAFNFFFSLIGRFNHYAFFTKKLWKKVKGFEDEDEAEVKCAFMSLWVNNTLGIPTYPVGMSWCNYYGDKSCFDEYINKWMPVFNAFQDWVNTQR